MFSVFFSPGLLASNAEIFPRILPKVLLTFGYFRQVFEPFGGAFCKNCTENIIVIFEQLLLYSRFSLSFVRSGAGGGRGRTPEGVWRCAQRHLRFALCCEWRARVLSILTPLPQRHGHAAAAGHAADVARTRSELEMLWLGFIQHTFNRRGVPGPRSDSAAHSGAQR